jgi:hypothetical protein
MNHVGKAAERREAARKALERETNDLRESLRLAHKVDGHTIAELVEWTGYSRRTIFYMLKEKS